MNQLQIFNYKGQEVRTVQKDNETWWVLKDVCEVLELSNSRIVSGRLDEDDVSLTYVTDNLGRNQQTSIINESGLYNVIMRSDKPEAKKFKRWVTHEVLPTIRKTGGYVANDDLFINTYLPHADEQTVLMFRSQLQVIKKLNQRIEHDKPKVLFADAVETAHTSILIGDLAKLIKQNGVDIGQKRLFAWLRNNGYLIKKGDSKNMPTQRAMQQELFEVKERTINNPDGSVRITKTTKVTGKGQIYFIDKFVERTKGEVCGENIV